MKKVLVALALPLAGCDPSPQAVTSCPGAAPALASCEVGRRHATCDEVAGEPRFACSDGRCLWFTNGCVAEGFVASDCPADDLCCHADWPYAEESDLDRDAFVTLYAGGREPWDRERAMNVTVAVDETLAATGTSFECGSKPLPDELDACEILFASANAQLASTLYVDARQADFASWYPWVEIDGDRARVCAAVFTDVLHRTCEVVAEPVCASGGSVRISRRPAPGDATSGLVVAIDAAFGEVDVRGTIVIP